MFVYALVKYERLYRRLLSIETRDMSESGHIVHRFNRKTVEQKYTKAKTNGQPTKRSPNQTDERTPRPHSPAIPQLTTDARVPSDNKDPKMLRRLLRSQHNLPITLQPRKERLRQ